MGAVDETVQCALGEDGIGEERVQVGMQVRPESALPSAIGTPPTEVGEEPTGSAIKDFVPQATGAVTDGLEEMALACTDGAAGDDRLTSGDKVAGGQVANLLGRGLGVEVEVKVLKLLHVAHALLFGLVDTQGESVEHATQAEFLEFGLQVMELRHLKHSFLP